MLRAGAEPADEERDQQHSEAGAGAGQAIAQPGERSAGGEHRGGAEALRRQAGGNLQARHRRDKHAAQRAKRRIIEPELRLPYRQHDVDEVGVAVVQRMRDRGDRRGPSLRGRDLFGQRRKIVPMRSWHRKPRMFAAPRCLVANLTFASHFGTLSCEC